LFMQFNYFMTAHLRMNNKEVLLTFDDGPDPQTTPIILDILRKHEVKAIFFVIGNKALAQPELLKQMVADGHAIGNHTQKHPPLFALMSGKNVRREIEATNQTLEQIIGKGTRLFRPPVGYTNPIIARVVTKLNIQTIGWSARSYDSFITKPEWLLKRVLRITKPGNIVLMHDNRTHTAAILDDYLNKAQQNGIIFAKQATLNAFIHEINA
jgi:peptidoglycan/xylan/chitin deacetylase (PgdA/CDA1 family)